jgi:hypothetical protein
MTGGTPPPVFPLYDIMAFTGTPVPFLITLILSSFVLYFLYTHIYLFTFFTIPTSFQSLITSRLLHLLRVQTNINQSLECVIINFRRGLNEIFALMQRYVV